MNYSKSTVKINNEDMTIYSINNDVNGNPRYVLHYLALASTHNEALSIIKNIGGRSYGAKWFGGGVVFTSYSVEDDLEYAIDKHSTEHNQPLDPPSQRIEK
jgi:hypothetical protein